MVVNRGVCREGLIDVAKYSTPIKKTHIIRHEGYLINIGNVY